MATLRSNKSVFPLQTTYAVALTLPSSLRYQAGSQGRVENEMPGRLGVRGWEGRGATLFVPSFLTISSIHRRLFFSPPRLSSVLDRPITRPRVSSFTFNFSTFWLIDGLISVYCSCLWSIIKFFFFFSNFSILDAKRVLMMRIVSCFTRIKIRNIGRIGASIKKKTWNLIKYFIIQRSLTLLKSLFCMKRCNYSLCGLYIIH